MADPAPPTEVPLAFLRQLRQSITDFEEHLIPVLRGSLLLRCWYGDLARPAADLDLECFAGPRPAMDSAYYVEPPPDRFGRYGEYESLVDFGKAMCRYAANNSRAYQWRGSATPPDVEFEEADPPAGGTSLWVYGTPGERYYTGWTWNAGGGATGILQIDIAAGGYPLDAIAVEPLRLNAPGTEAVEVLAYTPETLLAAKFSWLLRSVQPGDDWTPAVVAWVGEMKDLFDSYLLLTRGELRPEPFRKSLLAIGTQDNLEWGNMATLFATRHAALTDADFPAWADFCGKYPMLACPGPAEMLLAVLDRVEPLLGEFYRPDELPFLDAINATLRIAGVGPTYPNINWDDVPTVCEEMPFLAYADWLDENGHPERAAFVRRFAAFAFRDEGDRTALLADLEKMPGLWLQQLFGSASRVAEVRLFLSEEA